MEFAQPQADATQNVVTEPVVNDAQPVNQPFLTVKYNKEDKALTKEEAATLAQKGMNYDKITEKLTQSEQKTKDLETKLTTHKDVMEFFELVAKDTGQSIEQIAKSHTESYWRRRDEKIADEKGIPVEAVRDIRLAKWEAEAAKRKAEELAQQNTQFQTQQQRTADQVAQITEFRDKYGEDTTKALPEEVLADFYDRGIPLEYAYNSHQSKLQYEAIKAEQAQKQHVEQVNEENAKASTGKLGDGAESPFEITEEWIDKASPEQLKKHHSKVYQFLTGRK